jgi:hypothetical protein
MAGEKGADEPADASSPSPAEASWPGRTPPAPSVPGDYSYLANFRYFTRFGSTLSAPSRRFLSSR